jgi:hypothetical protein
MLASPVNAITPPGESSVVKAPATTQPHRTAGNHQWTK